MSGTSSYHDRTGAERAVSENMAGNAPTITSWLQSGTSPTLATDWQHERPTGRHLPGGAHDTTAAAEVSGSRVVLRRDPTMPEGYKILTTFPVP